MLNKYVPDKNLKSLIVSSVDSDKYSNNTKQKLKRRKKNKQAKLQRKKNK
jgi:hypothetical protein